MATPAARPAMEILAELLDTQSLITVPICRRSPRPCWVLLDSAHRRYRSRNAELLFGRQGRRFTELFGLEVSVHCEGDISTNRKLAEACFHLVSEALTNIRRHTRATRAEIFVAAEPDTLILRIGNDHGAEEPSPATFVPRSIAERAESLHGCALVDLRRPGFTDLIISIPRT